MLKNLWSDHILCVHSNTFIDLFTICRKCAVKSKMCNRKPNLYIIYHYSSFCLWSGIITSSYMWDIWYTTLYIGLITGNWMTCFLFSDAYGYVDMVVVSFIPQGIFRPCVIPPLASSTYRSLGGLRKLILLRGLMLYNVYSQDLSLFISFVLNILNLLEIGSTGLLLRPLILIPYWPIYKKKKKTYS